MMIEKIRRKMVESKGETLVELLASILIGTLAVSLLVSGIVFASRMNQQTYETDKKFYEGLNHAENKDDAIVEESKYFVNIAEGEENLEVEITLYGAEGSVYSYSLNKDKDTGEEGGE